MSDMNQGSNIPGQSYPEPAKRSSSAWIWWVLGGIVLVVIICVGACVAFGGLGMLGVMGVVNDVDAAKTVVAEFMQSMEDGDYDHSLSLFVDDVTDLSEIEDLGSNARLFEGYENISVSGFNVNTDSKGTFADLNGTVSYTGGKSGTFEATLQKISDKWKIYNINIKVSGD